MPIPLIIYLDALAAAAGAANANPAAHSATPAIPPAWLGAATAASHTNGTSIGPTGRPAREESVASTLKSTAAKAAEASLVHPPGESPVSPRIATSRPVDGSAQPSMDLPTVALDVGTEQPLQLLPGTLEVLEEPENLTPIRFFRTAALEIPEVTLGRAQGPAYRHINLWAPSVSRMHARMRFEGGRWKIFNLSQTSSLRANDLGLDAPEVGRILDDGDRIQLCEVVLRYREQRA